MAMITAPASFLSVLTAADVTFARTDFESRSLFNARRQVLSYPSASHWRLNVSTYPQTPEEARLWRLFVMRLRGRENWFECPMPAYDRPSTGYTGAIKVNGTPVNDFTLNLKSMTPSTLALRGGDMFTVADQCFVASADVTSDSSGEGEVSFDAPLRSNPGNGEDLIINAPYFLCASVSSNAATWTYSEKSRQAFVFNGAEHF
jgi:hypothetical protein